jgi:quercetin dioxygenase-like cupin family protein
MSKITSNLQKTSWTNVEKEKLSDALSRQAVYGEKATIGRFSVKRGGGTPRHSHPSEEYALLQSGTLKYTFDDHEVLLHADDFLVVPPNVPHAIYAVEDTEVVYFFSPAREDWLRGEDQYLRK